MRELIVATKNKGKLKEIKELLKEFDLKVTSLAEYPDVPEIVEDGKDFYENALIKARTVARHTGKLVLGEDSGIEVEYLNNAPGLFSSRFAGEDATDDDNNAKLMRELDGVPKEKRKARYRCFVAMLDGEKIVGVVDGRCEGYIATEPHGENGFGYDPYFLIEEYGKTFGELDPAIKSKISHRAKALVKVKELIKEEVDL